MKVLGIETSCDETAAAIVERNPEGSGVILANVVRSQIDEHHAFGGVVPEIAARSHVQWLTPVIDQALAEAGMTLKDIDGIAATAGPGLIGGLLVGLTHAKAMARSVDLPMVAINHLEAHALTARLTDNVPFPYLLLLVSGGHSQFVLVEGVGRYTRWGSTIDDALGEAFDKVAKLLGLPYPGGPAVETEALRGDPARFDFPRPLLREARLDFSFSGLKTAVRLAAERIVPLSQSDVADICAGFQKAIVDVLAARSAAALRRFRDETGANTPVFVVAGGVAANQAIGSSLERVATEQGARLVIPPAALCTDNGAMVAWAGAERLARGECAGPAFRALPRWPLDQANREAKAS